MNRTDDECYTGTGPAAEVARISIDAPLFKATIPVPSAKPGQPPMVAIAGDAAESGHWFSPEVVRALLAQRDELAAALECVLRDHLAVHGVGDVEMQPSLFQARSALSRIKGA